MLNPNVALWKHQRAMLGWMLERPTGILNAGMGTGKTLTTLAYLDRMRFNRTLIVTTGKGVAVWQDEIDEKLAKHPVVVDDNDLSIKSQAERISELKGSYIYLTTYSRLWREPLTASLIKAKFDCIILDESHKIAAPNSKVSKAAAKIGKSALHRFCLTGTLLTNNPMNIFGQARFVEPNMFDKVAPNMLKSFNRFREYFCHLKPIAGVLGAYYIVGYKNMEEYNDVLNSYVYRVVSDEVLELPEEVHKTIRLSWSHSTTSTIYKKVQTDKFAKWKERVIVADNVLVSATRLHQLAGGFIVTSDPMGNPKETQTDLIDRAKLDGLVELVEELDETEPAIIFAKYTEEIYHIAASLKDFGSVSILSGKRDELKEWQQGKTRFIVVQTETGSEAIDLSRAKYTFIYSVGWSLANYEQMLRRMRRPRKDGTKAETVFYYHLIMSNTIDVEISRALRNKQQITNKTLERIVGYKNE